MTSHQVQYDGPSSLAVPVATLLADADGIDLISAEKQENSDGPAESVILVLTVEGTTEAVVAAVESVRAGLPAEASLTVEDPVQGP